MTLQLTNDELGFFRRWCEVFAVAGLLPRPLVPYPEPRAILSRPHLTGEAPPTRPIPRPASPRATAAGTLRGHALRLANADRRSGGQDAAITVPKGELDALLEALEAGAKALGEGA